MPRVIHFEINADDPARANQFYADVFGWKIEKWQGPIDYWLIATGEGDEPGIDGAIQKRQNPGDGVVNTISVDSIDDFVKKIVENGGKVTAPKMVVPGVGYAAQCLDTEGNAFGLMQSDPEAK